MNYLKVIYSYLKDRFTKELFSTYGGMLIVVLFAMGYIDSDQYAMLSEVAKYMGWSMPVIGGALVLAPTSKLGKSK